MPDLLQTGTRDYFRISESAACALVIGHRIAGTPVSSHGIGSIAMEMGSAMEPVINRFLMRQGLSFAFADLDDGGPDPQLEVACQDPLRIGHPDGLVYLAESDKLSDWALMNLPKRAQELLASGQVLLSEVKTMGDADWRQFTAKGLLGSGVFVRKYFTQINAYLGAMMDPATDELWPDHLTDKDRHGNPLPTGEQRIVNGSDAYRLFLVATQRNRPQYCLVTAFNTAVKQFSFDLVSFDPVEFAITADRLETEVAVPLHNGEMPAPTYDGSAPDCFFCPYTQLCPAVIARKQADAATTDVIDLLDLSVEAPTRATDLRKLEDLGARYNENAMQIKALTADQKLIGTEIKSILGGGETVLTEAFKLHKSEIPPRVSVDLKELRESLNRLHLTLAEAIGDEAARLIVPQIPYKRGMPSERLYVVPRYGPTYESGSEGEDSE